MNKLKVITSTNREASKGIIIANWITELANASGKFDVELLDLRAIGLPFMDEPHHPRLQQYQHAHTKQWSAKIGESDAFIIVLGEYNFSIPAPIKNALDYLFNEWKHKPFGIVSYGGVSGGLRATQMLKQVITSFNAMPISESVTLPFFAKSINEEGQFVPEEPVIKSANAMINALDKWSNALKSLRS
jgi:NAD(P)H-dependent FMN reductase